MKMENANIVFQKEYNVKPRMWMTYLKSKKGPRKVLYETELLCLEDEEMRETFPKYKDVIGVYCPKCGELHEFTNRALLSKKRKICSCGDKYSIDDCTNVNRSSVARKEINSIWDGVPYKLKISEKGERIHISAIGKNYYLNAKASKAYFTPYQVTVIINTATGQTYVMPPKYKNELVFYGDQSVRTASFSYNTILTSISKNFFMKDAEAMKALEEVFKRHVPIIKKPLISLQAVAHANYLKELYEFYPEENKPNPYDKQFIWQKLRRRYNKDPETFPKYLYYGCSKVATKSIRKMLYKHPEKKWALHFLHKNLGLENVDVLRNVLEKREDIADLVLSYCLYSSSYYYDKRFLNAIRTLAKDCKDNGWSDSKIVSFLLPKNANHDILKDAANMYVDCNRPTDYLDRFKNLSALHNALSDLLYITNNYDMYKRYSREIEYDDNICALEGEFEDAQFTVIKRPWDLRALGQKFHNCVGSYMESVKSMSSIIVEMTIHGKPEACIELDSTGKRCYQAYAACNMSLEGTAKTLFDKWAKKNGITSSTRRPYFNNFIDEFPF